MLLSVAALRMVRVRVRVRVRHQGQRRAWNIMDAKGRQHSVLLSVAALRMVRSSPPMASTLPAATECISSSPRPIMRKRSVMNTSW